MIIFQSVPRKTKNKCFLVVAISFQNENQMNAAHTDQGTAGNQEHLHTSVTAQKSEKSVAETSMQMKKQRQGTVGILLFWFPACL